MLVSTWSFRLNIRRTPFILILLLTVNVIFIVFFRSTGQIWRFRPIKIDFSTTRINHNHGNNRNVIKGDVATSSSPPPNSPGRLFYCGWDSAPNNIFPEYDYQEKIWNPSKVNSTNNDILVVGMYGPCLGQRRFFSKGGPAIIHKLFHGKVLYLNGEAYGHLDPQVIDREYQIGPYSPPSEYPSNSLLVYFFAMSFGLLNTYSDNPIWDWIFVPEQRRDNTGRYNGVAYYASKCLKFRQRAARQISEVVPVYYGKGCKVQQEPTRQLVTPNYTDNAIQLVDDGGGRYWQQNYKFFHDFKYCLAIENSNKTGYITEKLLNAFLAGCLPIYFGTREVFNVFNEDAFVFYDISQPQPALDKIMYLEEHPDAYMQMLRAPILKNGSTTIDDFFSIYPNIGNGNLNRKIRQMMGLKQRIE